MPEKAPTDHTIENPAYYLDPADDEVAVAVAVAGVFLENDNRLDPSFLFSTVFSQVRYLLIRFFFSSIGTAMLSLASALIATMSKLNEKPQKYMACFARNRQFVISSIPKYTVPMVQSAVFSHKNIVVGWRF